jgi:hypothetical protein
MWMCTYLAQGEDVVSRHAAPPHPRLVPKHRDGCLARPQVSPAFKPIRSNAHSPRIAREEVKAVVLPCVDAFSRVGPLSRHFTSTVTDKPVFVVTSQPLALATLIRTMATELVP